MSDQKFNFRPYLTDGKEVWMTDGIAEAVVHTFEDEETAKIVAELLNGAYNGAYTDGYYASTRDKFKELFSESVSLAIKNLRLEEKLKKYEGEE